MRPVRLLEKAVLLIAAIAVNLGLYLLVPYIQVLIKKHANPPKSPAAVVRPLEFAPPPAERLVKREIKEIKLASLEPPQQNPSRPAAPGGGLKIDLSPAGGEGPGLLSGSSRTGPIGGGSGDGPGTGMGAMTYEMGQTDTDAKIVGPDPAPGYPPRAAREGVTGVVDLTFVVNEAGRVTQVQVVKEEPSGYGFAVAAIAQAKSLQFKPATLQKMAVRQRFKRRYTFDQP